MLLHLSAAALLASMLLQAPAGSTNSQELRARLARYEQQLAGGKPDRALLEDIARVALARAAQSSRAEAVVAACASEFAAREACAGRLWAIARQESAPLADRASAVAALVRQKDKEAPAYLLGLARNAPPSRTAALAEALLALPAEDSVPLLAAALDSGEPAAMIAACRALGLIDSGESRLALTRYLNAAPRGTEPWFNCTFASARLGDIKAQQLSRSLFPYLKGSDLVAGGDVLLDIDEELAVSLLLQATRQTQGLTPLEAADRLAPVRPDAAQAVMEPALQHAEPAFRAAALQVHRSLKVPPDQNVRALLADPDPVVAVRAAETVLDSLRRQGPHGRGASPVTR